MSISSGVRARRFQDWPSRFARFLAERYNEPFVWGSNDCALFACDGVQAIIGVDLAQSLRGYKTKRGAFGSLKRAGFKDLRAAAAALTAVHGFPAVWPGHAQRGDLVLIETERGQALGLIDLSGNIIIADEEKPVLVPWRLATDAWRI